MCRLLITFACLLWSFVATAEQFKAIKDIEAHYVVFNSTFLTPKVARAYDLKRNEYTAIVNISLLDRLSVGKPVLAGKVKGTAMNLLGQSKVLEFREVREGNAIYYLAQFSIVNQELYRFTIDVDAGIKGKGQIKFNQTLYAE
ncbi:DUF4426 domain-containing protein [Vibrio hippocampi]|uniref:DUF4426 domain-containing protein n=1 Tax=Vibrio hippocampi TaxID=654686 RepID=A0ABM8ZJH8_9VIBR|nr:DUF4426 domain-containing protein [Vibrio hippocampi]CAH0527019.1 hypothetical protein VHP8226_02348 [Vibrio hippocampi]